MTRKGALLGGWGGTEVAGEPNLRRFGGMCPHPLWLHLRRRPRPRLAPAGATRRIRRKPCGRRIAEIIN